MFRKFFHRSCLVAILGLCTFGASSSYAKPPTGWATINICDTALHPNEVGVRAQLEAFRGKKGTASVRFQLQYRTEANTWQILKSTGADSGFKKLGTAGKVNQAGWTFQLKPPTRSTYVVRGLVTMRWIVPGPDRAIRVITQAGHPNTVEAEPETYSERLCTVS